MRKDQSGRQGSEAIHNVPRSLPLLLGHSGVAALPLQYFLTALKITAAEMSMTT